MNAVAPIWSDDMGDFEGYRYSTIVADPPWPYSGAGPVGAGGRGYNNEAIQVSASNRYDLMPVEEIESLLPTSLLDDNAHLYLWTTNSFMDEAYDVARAWGFVPKTIITWVKVMADIPSSPSMKAGYYFRGATEHCLFGVRGSLALQTERAIATAFLHPRLPHSVKPPSFMDMVEECSPSPRLEIFSRSARPGWHAFGNQIEHANNTASIWDQS